MQSNSKRTAHERLKSQALPMQLAKTRKLDVVGVSVTRTQHLVVFGQNGPLPKGSGPFSFSGSRNYGVRRISLSESKRIRVVLIAA